MRNELLVQDGDRRPSGLQEENIISESDFGVLHWIKIRKLVVPNANKRKGGSEDANEDHNPQGSA